MTIFKELGLNVDNKHVISFVGAGGKSTTMDILAKELKSLGKKVLVTTTTTIFEDQHKEHDVLFLGKLPETYIPTKGTITLLGKKIKDGKIRGIIQEEIEVIFKRGIFDILLIEADGARMKAMKGPGDHEPVVVPFSTTTIGVIGLDAVGNPLDQDHVHRPEILSKLLEVETGHIIEAEDLVKLVLHQEGLFKKSHGKKVLFLNKASNEERVLLGEKIRKLLDLKGFKDVYITEIRKSIFY